MPYNKRDELPEPVQKLPDHAQDIYMGAFNSAFDQYKGDEAEKPCHRLGRRQDQIRAG